MTGPLVAYGDVGRADLLGAPGPPAMLLAARWGPTLVLAIAAVGYWLLRTGVPL